MSRLITLKQIYNEVISRVTGSKEEWKDFLSFASGIYKYNFDSALLIYAQRPDATIVADMPIWNRKVGRYINKGARSIAVFDTNQPVLKLSYLFDIKDTNGTPDTIPVMWRLNANDAGILTRKLNEINNVSLKSLQEHIVYMAETAVEDSFNEYTEDIENDINGTNLESLPYEGIITLFKQIVKDSIKYLVGKRCGLELDDGNNFTVINQFAHKALAFRMGSMVCSISKDIINELRNTSRIIHRPRDGISPGAKSENLQPEEPKQKGSFFVPKKGFTQLDIFDHVSQPVTEDFKNEDAPALLDIPQDIPHNYRYSPEDEIGIGGQRTKFRANIEAIKTLKVIEEENRLATPGEQRILVRYTGWGGLVQAFDPDNEAWHREYAELKELLTKEEYESARASTPNAHYTSFIVIEAMLKTLERFGLKKGNIIEPSIGVGYFFSLLPESMKDSKLYGVEIDDISGRIAKQLYQDADIRIQGFEESDFPDNFFDVAIGNVPFGDYKLHDTRYDRYNFNIHDYFFAKSLDKVRPGGIIAFITSKGTLDKENPSIRRYISERAELIGAVRLPCTAFKVIANTDVTTDIIFLQKRERMAVTEPEWLHLGYTDDEVPVNQYYLDNPHMMLGRMIYDSRMFGSESKYTSLVADENLDLAEALENALSTLKADIRNLNHNTVNADDRDLIPADPSVKNYTYTFIGDNLYYRENAFMRRMDIKGTALERIKGLHDIRKITRDIIDIQLSGCASQELKSAQAELNSRYDNFVDRYGIINSRANNIAFRDDSDYPLLCSLEVLDNDGNAQKADMFTKQTIRPKVEITEVDTAAEALAVSLNEKGRVDLAYMTQIYESTPESIISELKGLIYLK